MKKYIIIGGVIELIVLIGVLGYCVANKKQNKIEQEKQMCWMPIK